MHEFLFNWIDQTSLMQSNRSKLLSSYQKNWLLKSNSGRLLPMEVSRTIEALSEELVLERLRITLNSEFLVNSQGVLSTSSQNT